MANLVPIKGIETLIDAFEVLSINYPDWKLLIVGDDTTEYGLQLKKDLLNKQHLIGKVIFTGKQKNVREFLDISEIYVQPTIGQGEGAPIAVLEAMVNGKNIIASDVSGIRDQLSDFPKHLFKRGSVSDLTKKLTIFMDMSEDENRQIGELFNRYVKKNYSLKNEVRLVQRFYNQII